MNETIDWDVELAKVQLSIELDAFVKKVKALCLVIVERVKKIFSELARIIGDEFLPRLKTLYLAIDDLTKLQQQRPFPKEPRYKRPLLFVAYNQIPDKRPLKGRRGRR